MGTMNRPQAPTAAQLQREVDRVRDRKRFQSALCRTLGALALIAAFVAAVVYMAPVLRVRGTSMSPTLSEGDVLVALRGIPCGRGDIAAFDDGTHILVKRIIAGAGDVVDIGEDGAVTVNGQALEEPYVAELARGDLDVDLPCRVPGGLWFVMGDHRAVSVDSRSTAVGLLTQEQLLGRVVLRVWPPDRLTLLTGGANTGEE